MPVILWFSTIKTNKADGFRWRHVLSSSHRNDEWFPGKVSLKKLSSINTVNSRYPQVPVSNLWNSCTFGPGKRFDVDCSFRIMMEALQQIFCGFLTKLAPDPLEFFNGNFLILSKMVREGDIQRMERQYSKQTGYNQVDPIGNDRIVPGDAVSLHSSILRASEWMLDLRMFKCWWMIPELSRWTLYAAQSDIIYYLK